MLPRSSSSPLLDVSVSPLGSLGGSDAVGPVTLLSEASVLLAGRGETAELAFVVFFGHDPVDAWVLLDGLVGWVDHDDLEELVGGILTYPVRVEHSGVAASSADLLLGDGSVRAGLLELSDALVHWLSEDDTLVDCSLSSSSSDSDSPDSVALLLLEAKGSGLVQSRWLGGSVDSWELSVLPRSDSHDESENIRLLLSPQLLQIFVCTHLIIK